MARSARFRHAAAGVAAALVLLVAVHAGSEPLGNRLPWAKLADAIQQELDALRLFEADRRASTDFATLPDSERAFGTNPSRIAAVPGKPFLVGLLRGDDALVVLGDGLKELQRLPTPPLPTGLSLTEDGILVSGVGSGRLAWFAWDGDELKPAGTWRTAQPAAIRDVAVDHGGSRVFAADELGARLLVLDFHAGLEGLELADLQEIPLPPGPASVRRTPNYLAVSSLTGHTVTVFHLPGESRPDTARSLQLRYDGPIWSMDAAEAGGVLRLALGGAEDHPLDRTNGFFGNIDSYLYVVDVAPADRRLRAREQTRENLSALGVVTPKTVVLNWSGHGATVHTAGYGSETMLRLSWGDTLNAPAVDATPVPPGSTDLLYLPRQGVLLANPLLDAWISVGERAYFVFQARPTTPDARNPAVRLGEALFFTELMGPGNTADGAHSRFTCETCHFEGGIDGRVHYTGREDVHAVTKPLFGLFNNQPHFSRALDPDLATMVHNEFRVANAETGRDPWFPVYVADHPWLRQVGLDAAVVPPGDLRRGLVEFLMEFTHPANPRVLGRTRWTGPERQGAELFRARCESCHAARLVAADSLSRVPFERWEELTLSAAGPLVWASEDYQMTGVIPVMHSLGTRTPSLRRVSRKVPLFTNGSAAGLDAVLDGVRVGPVFRHAGETPEGRPLSEEEKRALLAFLLLL